ncbi:hypothetical protein CYMTET_32948, partial [Cymbomonas tetramitiformis]
MAAPARLRVLARLAETHSKQLCNRDILRALHQECQAAGLAVPFVGGGNDLERLQSIFTVALENNLASVIIQFVDEVVRDEMAVSSDIIEANMLDGDQVLFWVQTTYDSLLTKCARAHRQVLDDASVKLGGLTMVLEALRDPLESDDQKRVHVQGFEEGFEASRQRADELARVEALLRAVRVLQQFAELMAWVRGDLATGCTVIPGALVGSSFCVLQLGCALVGSSFCVLQLGCALVGSSFCMLQLGCALVGSSFCVLQLGCALVGSSF